MNFITSYYWQQSECSKNTSALLLLQGLCKKRKQRMVFACICAGKNDDKEYGILNAYITEQLQNWFYEQERFRLKCKRKRESEALNESLKVLLVRLDEELHFRKKIDLCGFLCVDTKLLYFGRGNMGLYMLNRRFGRDNMRYLWGGEENLTLHTGTIQQNVGILIATEDFFCAGNQKTIAECLSVWEISSQEQADKHLHELCTAAEQKGGMNIGAILTVAGNERPENRRNSGTEGI